MSNIGLQRETGKREANLRWRAVIRVGAGGQLVSWLVGQGKVESRKWKVESGKWKVGNLRDIAANVVGADASVGPRGPGVDWGTELLSAAKRSRREDKRSVPLSSIGVGAGGRGAVGLLVCWLGKSRKQKVESGKWKVGNLRDIAANVVGADASVGPRGHCGMLLPLPEQSSGDRGAVGLLVCWLGKSRKQKVESWKFEWFSQEMGYGSGSGHR